VASATVETTGVAVAPAVVVPTAREPIMKAQEVLCDQAVSRLVNAETGQEVYIVGTAHISKLSAELVRDTIRLTKPDKIMVELDSQRVKKRVSLPPPADGDNAVAAAPDKPAPTSVWDLIKQEFSKPVGFGEKVANIEAGIIGLVISSLYQKLDKMGFSSGQEFITAIREAEASGATLVLGDRPVDVTLKRLQQSIEKTGFDNVMAFANNQVRLFGRTRICIPLWSKNMSLLTCRRSAKTTVMTNFVTTQAEAPEEKLLTEKLSRDEAKLAKDEIVDVSELASTVEMLKERKNVRKIMASLKDSIPEVYMALIGERDIYMSQSILKVRISLSIIAKHGKRGWCISSICTNSPRSHT
jgi:pheromone shutdown protein TraB